MRRRLTRSRNAMIGGVAAGVAEWLNIDPAIVRIAWAILVPLTSGAICQVARSTVAIPSAVVITILSPCGVKISCVK